MQLDATYNTCISYTKNKKEINNNIKKKYRSDTSSETKIFGAVHSIPHLALNFLSVLFLKANVHSQRILSLSKTQKISKLGFGGFI